jgi:hypothetical protein
MLHILIYNIYKLIPALGIGAMTAHMNGEIGADGEVFGLIEVVVVYLLDGMVFML